MSREGEEVIIFSAASLEDNNINSSGPVDRGATRPDTRRLSFFSELVRLLSGEEILIHNAASAAGPPTHTPASGFLGIDFTSRPSACGFLWCNF